MKLLSSNVSERSSLVIIITAMVNKSIERKRQSWIFDEWKLEKDLIRSTYNNHNFNIDFHQYRKIERLKTVQKIHVKLCVLTMVLMLSSVFKQ